MKWDFSKLSARDKRALRDDLRNGTGQNMAALRSFYDVCAQKCADEQLIPWITALELQCEWDEREDKQVVPFEECLAKCRYDDKVALAIQHDLSAILDTPWDDEDVVFKSQLLHMVRLVKGKLELYPDFDALASDFCEWNDENKTVQRRWIRTIFPYGDKTSMGNSFKNQQ